MMEKEFSLYPEALALKELGFDEPCFGYYAGDILCTGRPQEVCLDKDGNYKKTKTESYPIIAAPTYSQAFRWFRDEHKLLHELVSVQENSWLISIVDMNSKSVNGVYMKSVNLDDIDENIPETYEEAELECLKKLIELTKN